MQYLEITFGKPAGVFKVTLDKCVCSAADAQLLHLLWVPVALHTVVCNQCLFTNVAFLSINLLFELQPAFVMK